MIKLKAFLDTSVLMRLLSGHEELLKLFSDKVLSKVTYVTSPVVFQELILVAARLDKSLNFEDIEKYVEIIGFDFTKSTSDFKKEIQKLRNMVVHSNDALIISIANEAKCDYLLTYDMLLTRASENRNYKAVTPEEFIRILGGSL
jgi:predicted nucleic acid-binding protein